MQDGLHRVGEQRGDSLRSGGVVDDGREQQTVYITTSVSRSGNKSLLLRERREQLKQKRKNRFKKCDRVNSKDVSQGWIQDRKRPWSSLEVTQSALSPA